MDSDLAEALGSVAKIVRADERDWTANRHDAFIYGLFHGVGGDSQSVLCAAAQRHGWDEAFLARLERLSAAVLAVAA